MFYCIFGYFIILTFKTKVVGPGLQSLHVATPVVSDAHFGFRKGSSTTDANNFTRICYKTH